MTITITVVGAISIIVVMILVGGFVALIPVKYVIGPELRALTEDARLDAQKARAMAATTHQGLQKLEMRVDKLEVGVLRLG